MCNALIVENDSTLRHKIKEILLSGLPSMHIFEAANELEIFDEIQKQLPDIVFMSINLSGENGLEMTKKIKILYPSVIVIILTNCDSPEYKEAAARLGADYFLSKKSDSLHDIFQLTEYLLHQKK